MRPSQSQEDLLKVVPQEKAAEVEEDQEPKVVKIDQDTRVVKEEAAAVDVVATTTEKVASTEDPAKKVASTEDPARKVVSTEAHAPKVVRSEREAPAKRDTIDPAMRVVRAEAPAQRVTQEVPDQKVDSAVDSEVREDHTEAVPKVAKRAEEIMLPEKKVVADSEAHVAASEVVLISLPQKAAELK
jgi:hypothetical protein